MMFSWGQSKSYQLALDTTAIVPEPILAEIDLPFCDVKSHRDYNIGTTKEGDIYSWGCNLFGRLGLEEKVQKNKIPKQIDIDVQVIQVSLGNSHVLARTNHGGVFAWGNGLHGQLGIGKLVP